MELQEKFAEFKAEHAKGEYRYNATPGTIFTPFLSRIVYFGLNFYSCNLNYETSIDQPAELEAVRQKHSEELKQAEEKHQEVENTRMCIIKYEMTNYYMTEMHANIRECCGLCTLYSLCSVNGLCNVHSLIHEYLHMLISKPACTFYPTHILVSTGVATHIVEYTRAYLAPQSQTDAKLTIPQDLAEAEKNHQQKLGILIVCCISLYILYGTMCVYI